jgi:hypothetical protein
MTIKQIMAAIEDRRAYTARMADDAKKVMYNEKLPVMQQLEGETAFIEWKARRQELDDLLATYRELGGT